MMAKKIGKKAKKKVQGGRVLSVDDKQKDTKF